MRCAAAVFVALAACGPAPTAAPTARPPVANTAQPASTADITFDLDRADRAVAPPVAGDLARYLAAATPSAGGDALVASIGTSLGVIECVLDAERRPATVANFVGLASGMKAWTDPRIGDAMVGVPYYDGLTFHRIISGHTWASACGNSRLASSTSPAAARAARMASSISATPPSSITKCLPPDTARECSNSAGARLSAASATTMPRAMVPTSRMPSAGPRLGADADIRRSGTLP